MIRTKNYRDSLVLKYNVDTQGNPISIEIVDEKCQVSPVNYTIHLMQIPDESHRVIVRDPAGTLMHEVFDVENLGVDNYKVDYAHGIIYFNPVHSGKTITTSYHGRGVEMIYAGRVLIDSNIPGENLGDLVNDFKDAFAELDRLQNLIDQIKKEYEEWADLIYADQPLLALQAQINLMKADSLDHVRWRENSINNGIITHKNDLITNESDKYLIRTEVD
uniref:Uncharacterized protein n=1 Tax=Siphoviridae sp. ctqSm5 TaxID=2827949 RepID=A0A8S5SQC8_9CAUD|nr:MAG TPA: hypothetical protein [Siphoviridae sp. ctqSm5]